MAITERPPKYSGLRNIDTCGSYVTDLGKAVVCGAALPHMTIQKSRFFPLFCSGTLRALEPSAWLKMRCYLVKFRASGGGKNAGKRHAQYFKIQEWK